MAILNHNLILYRFIKTSSKCCFTHVIQRNMYHLRTFLREIKNSPNILRVSQNHYAVLSANKKDPNNTI